MKKIIKRILNFIATQPKLTLVRKLFAKIIIYLVSFSKNGVVLFHNDPARSQIFKIIKAVKKETELLLTDNEAYQIYMAVVRTQKIAGDIAEVGVYQGGSAKLICMAKGDRMLHLFDTFNGLPATGPLDNRYQEGQFKASINQVKNYLKIYDNVYIYQGFFPNTAESVKDKQFSLVNLDVDIYSSTMACLKFFYQRMTKGGVIISHDYINVSGVRTAFDEFFSDKPEPLIELSGSQCLIVKI